MFDNHDDFVNAKDSHQCTSESYGFPKRNCDDIKRTIEIPLSVLVCGAIVDITWKSDHYADPNDRH